MLGNFGMTKPDTYGVNANALFGLPSPKKPLPILMAELLPMPMNVVFPPWLVEATVSTGANPASAAPPFAAVASDTALPPFSAKLRLSLKLRLQEVVYFRVPVLVR